jgi:hypothetical protein
MDETNYGLYMDLMLDGHGDKQEVLRRMESILQYRCDVISKINIKIYSNYLILIIFGKNISDHTEQSYLNCRILDTNTKVFDLTYKFNRLTKMETINETCI